MAPNKDSTISENGIKEAHSHILVMRLSAMGDVAMTIPVLKTFCVKYPQIKITFLTRQFFEPLFYELPNVSVYTADVGGKHKGLFGLWRLFKELRNLNINMIADLHNVLRSNILKFFFRFSKIPFGQIEKDRKNKKALTALKNKNFTPLKSTHQRYADVFESLGFSLDLSNVQPIEKQPLSSNVQKAIRNSSKLKIGIAPFAAYQGKMYPFDLMKVAVNELNNDHNYQLFFFGGGASEIKRLSQLETQFENGFNCAGRFSFDDELAIISNLDVMLSMDSSNGHLAALFGVPVLTLWGVTHPYAGFSPFNYGLNREILSDRTIYPLIPTSIYGNKVPLGYENVMSTISPSEIIKSIKEMTRAK